MSRTLSQEEMAALMNSVPAQGTATLSGGPPDRSPGLRRPERGEVPANAICLSARPQMASGWLNTMEGIKWNLNRVTAFQQMSAGRMTFGSTKKSKDE